MIKIKRVALILLVFVLLAFPLAIAEEGINNKNSDVNKVANQVGNKEVNKGDDPSLINKLKTRDLDRKVIEQAKNNYEKAKKNFIEAKNRYEERKKELLTANGSEKTIKAGNFLGVSINVLGEHLNKLRSQVESNKNLDEETAKEMLSTIDSAIAKLNELQTKINNAKSKDEIKADARDLRELWIDLKQKIDLQSKRIVNSKLKDVIERTETLEKKLGKALEKNAFINQEKLNEFKLKLEDSRNKFNQAQELLNNANQNMTKETIESINKLNTESKESLKQAHQILKEIISEIKSKDKTFNLDEVENE